MAVRHYNLVFKTVGPVHIGNGQTIGKKDYFQTKNGIAILNMPQFVKQLSLEQLEAYQEFLIKDSQSRSHDKNKGLQEFLDEDARLFTKAQKSIAYTLDTKLSKGKRGYNYLEAQAFVKDAYGKPYVPGSSVKGVLRTALLLLLIEQQPDRYLQILQKNLLAVQEDKNVSNNKKFKKALEDTNEALNKEIFKVDIPLGLDDKSTARDIMRCVSVSDSEPLDVSCLVFARKYDKFAKSDNASHKLNMGNKTDRKGNGLNIYRESLVPGTTVKVLIDIDDGIDKFLPFKLDNDGLAKILTRAFEVYETRFLSHFNLSDVVGANADNHGTIPSTQCQYIIQSGPFSGQRCRNQAVEGTGYCRSHQDKANEAPRTESSKTLACYLGGGVGFDSKSVLNVLFSDEQVDGQTGLQQMRLKIKSHLLLELFPEEHRHWQDQELGVSPHTLKLATINGKKYEMGRCEVRIEKAQ